MAIELLNKQSTEGCQALGLHKEVIQNVGATRTLLAEESGSLCLFDDAAGHVYTLPAPIVGARFEFLVVTTVTSNAHKVITSAGTVFLIGGIVMCEQVVALSGDFFVADGATHVALTAAGATAGGLRGERYEVTCISATQWCINGVCHGVGTLTDPFTTS